jgi:hypothetical protein
VSTAHNCIEFEVYFPDPLALNSTNHQGRNGSHCGPAFLYPSMPLPKILRRFVSSGKTLQPYHAVNSCPRCRRQLRAARLGEDSHNGRDYPTIPDNLKEGRAGRTRGCLNSRERKFSQIVRWHADRRRSYTLRLYTGECTKYLDPLACSGGSGCIHGSRSIVDEDVG